MQRLRRWWRCHTARGQAGAADAQLGKTNVIGSDQQSQADRLRQKLLPGYQSLADTGYLSPADKAAATTSEMGATAAPFETAKFEAANRASATNNASDLTAQTDQLALEQGRAGGDAAAHLQQQQMSNQLQGMYGLQGEESASRGEAMGMYGLGPSTLGARAAGPSGDQLAADYIRAATGAGSKIAGGFGAPGQ